MSKRDIAEVIGQTLGCLLLLSIPVIAFINCLLLWAEWWN